MPLKQTGSSWTEIKYTSRLKTKIMHINKNVRIYAPNHPHLNMNEQRFTTMSIECLLRKYFIRFILKLFVKLSWDTDLDKISWKILAALLTYIYLRYLLLSRFIIFQDSPLYFIFLFLILSISISINL